MPRNAIGSKQARKTPEVTLAGEIVLIDAQPFRDRATADCSAARARLEQARSSWHRFERKDKPAFARWRAREFGALLSRAREVETQIHDYQAIVHEVEMEMRRGFQDAYRAYQRVMARRADPSAESPAEEAAPRPGEARKLSDFEKEALFQEWVKRSLGTNPDKMDDEAYSASFEAFKSHMFRPPAEEAGPRANRARPARPEPARTASAAPEPDDEVDARLKELYRRLVRRLHPDLRADGSATVSALWHEVQEAYLSGDVARMEILLALSDIETNRSTGQSLAQLYALQRELERACWALEKSLLEAEDEEAWDFARSGPRNDLRRRVERQLKSDLAARSHRLDLLARTIADWAQGPVANRTVLLRRTR